MLDIKITTFNAEWMYSFFAKKQAKFVSSFSGAKAGPISLEPIGDVKKLCSRIGKMFDEIRADVITIVEGPQLKEQMALFVKEYMHDNYEVYTHGQRQQNIHLLVKKGLGSVRQFDYDSPQIKFLRRKFYYYPWGAYKKDKSSSIYRIPVAAELTVKGKKIIFVAVHTKSKISKLKSHKQWMERDEAAILDALNSRQKLSGEIRQIRLFLNELLKSSNGNQTLAIMGDFNDGPFADLMENDFLIHNIIDEIQGSLLEPELRLFHTMPTETIMKSYSTIFSDPFGGDEPVQELIDHILVSGGIADKASGIEIQPGSALVEYEVYYKNNEETKENKARDLRPSDHLPVSVILKIR